MTKKKCDVVVIVEDTRRKKLRVFRSLKKVNDYCNFDITKVIKVIVE